MKIGLIVRRPTQFDAPFFRYITQNDSFNRLDVFFTEAPDDWPLDKETGLRIHWGTDLYSGYSHLFLTGVSTSNAVRKIKAGAYDLVIFNGYKNGNYRLAKELKKRHLRIALRLDTVCANKSSAEILLRRILLTKAYRVFDFYFAAGSASRYYLQKMNIPARKVGLFPYCTDNSLFEKACQPCLPITVRKFINEASRIILVVAKFIKRESPIDVLLAFKQLWHSDLKLIVVGEGPLESYLKKSVPRSLCHKILFTGYLPYNELPAYFRASALFIHPARREPWGVSVQEAIASGCRVIYSNRVGSGTDLVQDGCNGYSYSPGNIPDLIRKINLTLQIPDRLVICTNKKVLEKWNYREMWKNILSIQD